MSKRVDPIGSSETIENNSTNSTEKNSEGHGKSRNQNKRKSTDQKMVDASASQTAAAIAAAADAAESLDNSILEAKIKHMKKKKKVCDFISEDYFLFSIKISST